MNLDHQALLNESSQMGFRPEILEKVIRLIQILNGIQEHPFLRDRLALKGGTALNLFLLNLPRLSVDIDLNYVGQLERDKMLAERPQVEAAIETVCQVEGMTVIRIPGEHAGGKWRLRYNSVLGGQANLMLDLNFMFRQPLWEIGNLNSVEVGSFQAMHVQVVSEMELAVGKLAALFSRTKARDVYDTVQIFETQKLDRELLRLGFIVYGGINRRDWRTIKPSDVILDPSELEKQLKPVLRRSDIPKKLLVEEWADELTVSCHKAVEFLFPFRDEEMKFLDALLDTGKIHSELLTDDLRFQEKIRNHPSIRWKSLNVKERKDD